MRQTEKVVLSKIMKYCDDIDHLLVQFDHSYERYCREIAFQYACNMCIIQIGELVSRLSDDFYAGKSTNSLACHQKHAKFACP